MAAIPWGGVEPTEAHEWSQGVGSLLQYRADEFLQLIPGTEICTKLLRGGGFGRWREYQLVSQSLDHSSRWSIFWRTGK